MEMDPIENGLDVDDEKFFHPYMAPMRMENTVIDFDIQNLQKLLVENNKKFPVEKIANRVREHYLDSSRLIKRAFGKKIEDDFQLYNWGLTLTMDMGLATDKLELLLNVYAKKLPRRITYPDFERIIKDHSSWRKIRDRREKSAKWLDLIASYKMHIVKKDGFPDTIGKRQFHTILDVTEVDLELDVVRLTRDIRRADKYSNKLHMLLLDDPLIKGNFNAEVGQMLQDENPEDSERLRDFETRVASEEEQYGPLEQAEVDERMRKAYQDKEELDEKRRLARQEKEAKRIALRKADEEAKQAKLDRLAEIKADREAHERRKEAETKRLEQEAKDEKARIEHEEIMKQEREYQDSELRAVTEAVRAEEVRKAEEKAIAEEKAAAASRFSHLTGEERVRAEAAYRLSEHRRLKELERKRLLEETRKYAESQLALRTARELGRGGSKTHTGVTKLGAMTGVDETHMDIDMSATDGTKKGFKRKNLKPDTQLRKQKRDDSQGSEDALEKLKRIGSKRAETVSTGDRQRERSPSPVQADNSDIGVSSQRENAKTRRIDAERQKREEEELLRLEKSRAKLRADEEARIQHIEHAAKLKEDRELERFKRRQKEEEERITRLEEQLRVKAERDERIAESRALRKLEEERLVALASNKGNKESTGFAVVSSKQIDSARLAAKRKAAADVKREAAKKRAEDLREEQEAKRQLMANVLQKKSTKEGSIKVGHRRKKPVSTAPSSLSTDESTISDGKVQNLEIVEARDTHTNEDQVVSVEELDRLFPSALPLDEEENDSMDVDKEQETADKEQDSVDKEQETVDKPVILEPSISVEDTNAIPDEDVKESIPKIQETDDQYLFSETDDVSASVELHRDSSEIIEHSAGEVSEDVKELLPHDEPTFKVDDALNESVNESVNVEEVCESNLKQSLESVIENTSFNVEHNPEHIDDMNSHTIETLLGEDVEATPSSEVELVVEKVTEQEVEQVIDSVIEAQQIEPPVYETVRDTEPTLDETPLVVDEIESGTAEVSMSIMDEEHVEESIVSNLDVLAEDQEIVDSAESVPDDHKSDDMHESPLQASNMDHEREIVEDNVEVINASVKPDDGPLMVEENKFEEDKVEDGKMETVIESEDKVIVNGIQSLNKHIRVEDDPVVVDNTTEEVKLDVHEVDDAAKAFIQAVDEKAAEEEQDRAVQPSNVDDNISLSSDPFPAETESTDADNHGASPRSGSSSRRSSKPSIVSLPAYEVTDHTSFSRPTNALNIEDIRRMPAYEVKLLVPQSADGTMRLNLREDSDGEHRGIYFHAFKKDSAAGMLPDQDRLQPNDEIIQIATVSVEGGSLIDVVSALQGRNGASNAGVVEMVVRRHHINMGKILYEGHVPDEKVSDGQVLSPVHLQNMGLPSSLRALRELPAEVLQIEVPKSEDGTLRLVWRSVLEESFEHEALVLHEFLPDSAAATQGALIAGDELIAVNDYDMEGGHAADLAHVLSQPESLALPYVSMRVRRHHTELAKHIMKHQELDVDDYLANAPAFSIMDGLVTRPDIPSLDELRAAPSDELDVQVPKSADGTLRINLRHDDEGDTHGLFIHGFKPNSAAETQGLIHIGDELINICGVDVEGQFLNAVVAVLQGHQGEFVDMRVRRHRLGNDLHLRFDFAGMDGTTQLSARKQISSARMEVSPRWSQPATPQLTARSDHEVFQIHDQVQRQTDTALAELTLFPAVDIDMLVPKSKDGSLRIYIRHDDEGDAHGLFVHGFKLNSAAEKQGLLKVGDELISVNDKYLKGGYLEDIVAVLTDHVGPAVRLTIRRHLLEEHDALLDEMVAHEFEAERRAMAAEMEAKAALDQENAQRELEKALAAFESEALQDDEEEDSEAVAKKAARKKQLDTLIREQKRQRQIRMEKEAEERAKKARSMPNSLLTDKAVAMAEKSKPWHDFDVAVPKTNGELRIHVKHSHKKGLFIHGFKPGSLAESQGILHQGDELVTIEGHDVHGKSLKILVDILKSHTSDVVNARFRRHRYKM